MSTFSTVCVLIKADLGTQNSDKGSFSKIYPKRDMTFLFQLIVFRYKFCLVFLKGIFLQQTFLQSKYLNPPTFLQPLVRYRGKLLCNQLEILWGRIF